MTNLHARSSGALSPEDLETLRSMILRRRITDAEGWLVGHGFQRDRAKQIVFEQEMAISNAIYHPPVVAYIVIAVVSFAIAGFLYGTAMDAAESQRDATLYEGVWDIALAVLLAIPLIIGAFFSVRAILGLMDKLKYRLRYRRGTDRPS